MKEIVVTLDYYSRELISDEAEYCTIFAGSETKRYYRGSRLHREDGPAIIWEDGGESWYIDDLPHRIGYPQYTDANYTSFDGRTGWYVRGNNVSAKVRKYADSVGIDLSNISDDDRIMLTIFMSGL